MLTLVIRGSVPEGVHTSLLYGVVNSFVDVNDGGVNGLVGVALPPRGPLGHSRDGSGADAVPPSHRSHHVHSPCWGSSALPPRWCSCR